MENGNGNGKTLLAIMLAGATLVLNGGLWIVNRMTQMDDDRQKLAIVVEQRMGRIEARLDDLVYRLGARKGEMSGRPPH
jgi:hypothetical protein